MSNTSNTDIARTKNITTTKPKKNVMQHTLAGTGAGVIEVLVMQPLDVLKTRYQSSRFTGRYGSILDATQRILKVEGLRGFYKGTLPVLCIVTPRISMQFFGLAYFKPRFEQIERRGLIPTNSSAAIAGVCTGILQAVGLVTPLELIKVRQQTAVHQGEYRGLWATAYQVVRHEGIFALYNGLLPTVVRQSWGLAVKFTCYTQLRALLRADQGKNATEQPWRSMLAGGLSNVAVGILNSPPDVVKTRMQDAASASHYANSWQCAVTMARTEGFASFFRGAWLRVLRIAPGGAIQFAAYEYLAAQIERMTQT